MSKRVIKIVILFILVIVILISGQYMFKRLEYDKESFSTDIYSYVSPKATEVICINREYNMNELFTYDDSLSYLIDILGNNYSFPIVICQFEKGGKTLIAKVKLEQEENIKNHIESHIATPFPPKTIGYKDANIFIYSLPKNKFLSCTFYKGLFVASLEYKLIEDFVNIDPENTYYSYNENKEIIEHIRNTSLISIFKKLPDNELAVNYTANKDTITMEGRIFTKDKIDSLSIFYKLVPHIANLSDSICLDRYELLDENKPATIKIILNKIH